LKRSTDAILTTHTGSLVRPQVIIEAMARAAQALPYDDDAFRANLKQSVAQVVGKQIEVGIDIPSDGEFSKRHWVHYVTERLTGIEYLPIAGPATFSDVVYYDKERFPGFWANFRKTELNLWQPEATAVPPPPERPHAWVCTGKIGYRGDAAVQRDIQNFKAAVSGAKAAEGFLPCAAPCSVQIFAPSDAYRNDEEYVYAVGDALRNEYRAIIDAGLLLQLDDAILPMHYNPTRPVEEYLKWVEVRIAATNHALRDLPRDRIRYHMCWGSHNAPHTWDVPLKTIVSLLLKLKVGALSIEAANPRHEHEWQVWQDVKLPQDMLLIPGLISHSTNVVEHPELVAMRIANFARLVGRENVIAGTDCGFSQSWNQIRVHPEVQWAKLAALVEGARLASANLWARQAA